MVLNRRLFHVMVLFRISTPRAVNRVGYLSTYIPHLQSHVFHFFSLRTVEVFAVLV
jgi:hypothetical protein